MIIADLIDYRSGGRVFDPICEMTTFLETQEGEKMREKISFLGDWPSH